MDRKLYTSALFVWLLVLVGCARPDQSGLPTVLSPAETDAAPDVGPTLESGGPAESTSVPIPGGGSVIDDGTWAAAAEDGVLVVGTSADYKPFSYYNENYAIDGFEPELIRAMGEVLGLEVQMRDYAFDGLVNAVRLGQVEVAIAAISVTPERAGVVAFSNTYYTGLDAVVAKREFAGSIVSAEDLASYRIGVQRGSIYEDWTTGMVELGMLPRENLFVYAHIDQAVVDIEKGFIDLALMDLKPAESIVATTEGRLTIATTGLNRQNYAVAFPRGALGLGTALNAALTTVRADGTVAALAKSYLDLEAEEIIPPEPELPIEPELPPVEECVDGMAFIADLTYDDKNMTDPPLLSPGQVFTKVWRVQNIGTCTWDSSYALTYSFGNVPAAQMGGSTVPVLGAVAPGQVYDFSATLVAPIAPGIYQGFWEMRNGAGSAFGPRVWVGISVPGLPTATPLPTQTPSPDISFAVDRMTIRAGECVTFNWNAQNVKAAYFYSQGEYWANYPVPLQGSSVQCPAQSTSYYLRVVKLDDSAEVREIRITVQPSDAPAIQEFTLNPPNQIALGQCVSIRWNVTGVVNSVRILRDNLVIWDNAPLSATTSDCPPNAGNVAYVIEAQGPGGTSRVQRNLNVTSAVVPTHTPVVVTPTNPPVATATPPPPESTATPVPPTATVAPPTVPPPLPPVIEAFGVQPRTIVPGGCVEVTWRVGGDADLVEILRNDLVILGPAPVAGAQSDCLNEPGEYVYAVRAKSNELGDVAFAQERIAVQPQPTVPPPADLVGDWRLTTLSNQPVIEGSEITAMFGADYELNGSSGCNSYTSNYAVDNGVVQIDTPTGTQLLCGEPVGVMEQEQAYLQALVSAVAYQVQDNILTMFDRTRNPLLVFELIVEIEPR